MSIRLPIRRPVHAVLYHRRRLQPRPKQDPPEDRLRWIGVILAGLILATLALLTTCRKARTLVEIDLVTTRVKLTLLNMSRFEPHRLNLRWLNLSDFKAAYIPWLEKDLADECLGDLTTGSLSADEAESWMSFSFIDLARGTTVELSVTPDGVYEAQFSDAKLDGSALTLNGPIEWRRNCGSYISHPFSPHTPMTLIPGESPKMAFRLKNNNSGLVFARQAAVQMHGFGDELVLESLAGREIVKFSSIESGSIVMRDLGERKHKLNLGDRLETKELIGFVRYIKMAKGKIRLVMNGSAGDLRITTGESEVQLMPRLLNWLQSREHLALFWSALVYVVGLSFAILSWWRDPK